MINQLIELRHLAIQWTPTNLTYQDIYDKNDPNPNLVALPVTSTLTF